MQSFRALIRTSLAVLAGTLLLGQPQANALEVYDADMQSLGMLLDIHAGSPGSKETTALKLYLHKEQRYLQLDVGTGDLLPAVQTLYYSFKGCGGKAFVDSTLFYSIGKFSSNTKAFITGEDMAPADIIVKSRRQSLSFSPMGGCENLKVQSLMLVPVQELYLPFSLPVSLPLVFQE